MKVEGWVLLIDGQVQDKTWSIKKRDANEMARDDREFYVEHGYAIPKIEVRRATLIVAQPKQRRRKR